MSSKQIKDLIDLIKKTKDKKEQAKLKKILKELLSKTKNYKLRSTVRKPKLEVQTGIKEQVEKLINPVLTELKDDKTIYEELELEKQGEIEYLQDLLKEAPSEKEKRIINDKIDKAKEDKDWFSNSKKANLPVNVSNHLKQIKDIIKPKDLEGVKLFQREVRKIFPKEIPADVKRMITTAISNYKPELKKKNWKGRDADRERAQNKVFEEIDAISKLPQVDYTDIKNQPSIRDDLDFSDIQGNKEFPRDIGAEDWEGVSYTPTWNETAIRVAKDSQDINPNQRDQFINLLNQFPADMISGAMNANQEESKSSGNFPQDEDWSKIFGSVPEDITFGEGKRKRKTKGGAGFEDYLSFFGNIPGGSQALSMIPGFGSVLAPVFDLAQSASKIGSEIGKQVKGSPEKMSGDALSSLSPMKSLLPFSLPFGKGKRKTKGGNISGMFNQVGELTPQLSGVISKAPGAYGTLGALGNSQVGSITRVLGDIFSRFGLGKKPKRNIKGCGAVSMQGQNFPLSDYNQDLTTKGIVNNRLAKAKNQMAEVQKFNRSLNQKANVDQQNAVNQLFYTKLMYDVNKIQEEQKAERIKKRKVPKKD